MQTTIQRSEWGPHEARSPWRHEPDPTMRKLVRKNLQNKTKSV